MHGKVRAQYILSPLLGSEVNHLHSPSTDELILAAAKWSNELHGAISVFDDGAWTENKDLWDSVQQSSWDDLILDPEMKKRITDDIKGFFLRKSLYSDFAIPWKLGVIFHGVPRNGKIMSLKAIMRSLSVRPVSELSANDSRCTGSRKW